MPGEQQPSDKQDMLKKIQQAQKQAYERKKQAMIGIKHSSVLQSNGALTLEQMSLDRREEFNGDAYDPFNYQQRP